MLVVIDTSAIMAVITNERHKSALIEATRGADLVAPASVHWEIGNAFSSMLKRQRVSRRDCTACLEVYRHIPIRFYSPALDDALSLSEAWNIYAYDAYVLCCAQQVRGSLLTLDRGIIQIAKRIGVGLLEVPG